MGVKVACFSDSLAPGSDCLDSAKSAGFRFCRMVDAFSKLAAMDGLSVNSLLCYVEDPSGSLFCLEASLTDSDRSWVYLCPSDSSGSSDAFERLAVSL